MDSLVLRWLFETFKDVNIGQHAKFSNLVNILSLHYQILIKLKS